MNLSALFQKMNTLRVAVLGDYCLDMYWHADMTRSALSRETPHFPLPMVEERFSPGGAGNAACCVQALRPASVLALGVLGQDWRGQLLLDALKQAGVDTRGLTPWEGMFTNTYIKPLRQGTSSLVYEDPRIDFENFAPLQQSAEDALIQSLHHLENIDVLLVCDQMQYGCVTPKVRERVVQLAKEGLLVVVDSRANIASFPHTIIKPNDLEAQAATGCQDMNQAALALMKITGKPCVITLGEKGCLAAKDGAIQHIPGRQVPPPHDYVGAGDAFLAAFALAHAAGADIPDACMLGNMAAAVVIQKINTTGTASREEIEALW